MQAAINAQREIVPLFWQCVLLHVRWQPASRCVPCARTRPSAWQRQYPFLVAGAGSGLSEGRRTLSTNFLVTHQRDADCWTELLHMSWWGTGPWRRVSR